MNGLEPNATYTYTCTGNSTTSVGNRNTTCVQACAQGSLEVNATCTAEGTPLGSQVSMYP
eukprot:164989-Chlamydomonas_euryale.AAC.1